MFNINVLIVFDANAIQLNATIRRLFDRIVIYFRRIGYHMNSNQSID